MPAERLLQLKQLLAQPSGAVAMPDRIRAWDMVPAAARPAGGKINMAATDRTERWVKKSLVEQRQVLCMEIRISFPCWVGPVEAEARCRRVVVVVVVVQF